MKLLIITQKIDVNDDVLGFFHHWVEVFAEHAEQITVICLEKGFVELPSNVKVYSLGKENLLKPKLPRSDLGNRQGQTLADKIRYVVRFFKYIWKERGNYDAVFVHMNPEYVVLGGWLWRLQGKKVALWYNHAKGGLKVRVASFFANHIFHTSPYAYAKRFKKASIMPVGIDTEQFNFQPSTFNLQPSTQNILILGRISPVKHVDVMTKALSILDERSVDFTANIYGNPTDCDEEYYKKIRDITRPLEKKRKIFFHKGIPNYDTPAVYNKHDIFINATPSGSFDKSILEAISCGTLVLVCNESLHDILPKELFFKEGDSIDLANTLQLLMLLPNKQKEQLKIQLREKVVKEHGLDELAQKVVKYLFK